MMDHNSSGAAANMAVTVVAASVSIATIQSVVSILAGIVAIISGSLAIAFYVKKLKSKL